MSNLSTPAEVVDVVIEAARRKAKLPLGKMFLLGILAGAFIAFGAETSSLAAYTTTDVGICRLITGVVFPVGLILITIVGGELFTGNCLMVEALFGKEIGWKGLFRNWVVVWIGNLAGALLIVALCSLTPQWDYTSGALGAYTIKIAVTKANISFGSAFCSGILCNILVCAAVLGAFSAKDVIGKVVMAFIPICAFVVSGFEHSVANMYYLFAGLVAATNPTYVAKAEELYGITSDKVASLDIASVFGNLASVTLGNIVGGVALALLLHYAYQQKKLRA
jgi:formate transporter